MKADLITTKITKETLKLARKISAETSEPQYAVIERLVRIEAENFGLVAKKKKK